MKNIFVIGVMAFLMMSCFEDSGLDVTLKGKYVEIDEATTSTGLAVVKAYTRTLDGVGIEDQLRINLVGPHQDKDITVSFIVDPASTAVAGTHYQLITTGGTVTIPANSSFGYIRFTVLDDNIAVSTTTRDLKIVLTSASDDVIVSSNYSSFTRRIRTQ